MMISRFKYDVAISVAEENKDIAEQIAAALKKENVRYYYYEERAVRSWGEYIIHLTADSFGRRARYVLMITSEIFVQKYWSNIELQVALANRVRRKPHILQLRLDDTSVDGISRHVVYRDWKDNPEEVARIIKEKISMQKRSRWRDIAWGYTVIIIAVLLACYILWPGKPFPTHIQKMEKIRITGPGIDTFYISNIEVTVAEYRKFCETQKIGFPPQPPSSDERGPVRNVTWYEALAFCQWKQGRLPTEAEWTYAAGAGFSSTYSGGNNASKVAVYNRRKPCRVATKAPNTFRLYDMTGNVAEWCDDWLDTSYTWKIVRGGAYNSNINPVNELAVAYRTKEQPDVRQPYIGFRVVWNK
jgi:hypothetical protein